MDRIGVSKCARLSVGEQGRSGAAHEKVLHALAVAACPWSVRHHAATGLLPFLACPCSCGRVPHLRRCLRWAGYQGGALLVRRRISHMAGKAEPCSDAPHRLPIIGPCPAHNTLPGVPLMHPACLPAAPLSTHSFLRQLPAEQGIRLEFWRSSRSLHGTARMWASLARQRQRGTHVLPLRFEALRDEFNATAGAMQAAFAQRLPGFDRAALLGRSQECNPGAWSAEQQAANAAHVTAGQGSPELRSCLQAALWSDGAIRRRLCRLTAALEYPLPPECSGGGTQPGSTSAVETV